MDYYLAITSGRESMPFGLKCGTNPHKVIKLTVYYSHHGTIFVEDRLGAILRGYDTESAVTKCNRSVRVPPYALSIRASVDKR
jgi:hypothetical protein